MDANDAHAFSSKSALRPKQRWRSILNSSSTVFFHKGRNSSSSPGPKKAAKKAEDIFRSVASSGIPSSQSPDAAQVRPVGLKRSVRKTMPISSPNPFLSASSHLFAASASRWHTSQPSSSRRWPIYVALIEWDAAISSALTPSSLRQPWDTWCPNAETFWRLTPSSMITFEVSMRMSSSRRRSANSPFCFKNSWLGADVVIVAKSPRFERSWCLPSNS
mmetsp:Transcript_46116/g.109606  ORF Transcript_46116/g.109606 Transcript_46116/m.109606 type:complete len:218 (+) Transcript_46116:583-1236(+)